MLMIVMKSMGPLAIQYRTYDRSEVFIM